MTFCNTDVSEVDDFAASLPLWRRMVAILKGGPQSLAYLASELGHENAESLDRLVRRHKTLFTRVPGPDHVTRIALIENREVA